MNRPIILASASSIRQEMLRNAGVSFDIKVASLDEDSIKASLSHEQAPVRDCADVLAELKAEKVARSNPDALIIGSDQVLEFDGQTFSKPTDKAEAIAQLQSLSGKLHKLYSAAVIYDQGRPVWRYIGQAKMTMRPLGDAYISDYVDRNWDHIQYCVGGYQIEAEGARLFSKIDGDHFSILGMPLIQVLGYLTSLGAIDG